MNDPHMTDDLLDTVPEAAVPAAPKKRGRPFAKKPPRPSTVMTPEQMEARILELEAEKVALERRAADAPPVLDDDPNALVTVDVPMTTTGYPISINGKKYFGRMTMQRRVWDTILSMLGSHAVIQSELTAKRGNEVNMAALMAGDTVSRIMKRRQGRHILSGAS